MCNFMNTSMETTYFEDEQMQIVEIPYQNKSASMIVFLPKAGASINGSSFNYEYYQKSVNQQQARGF